MIVWGSADAEGSLVNSGAIYDPTRDRWLAPTSLKGAPSPRINHTAAWIDNKLLLWGGQGERFEADGGSYDPRSGTWSALTTTDAPSPRAGHTGVVAGNRWIIWGGYSGLGIADFLASGAILG